MDALPQFSPETRAALVALADPRLATALNQVLAALTEPPRRGPRPDRANIGWRSTRG